MIRRIEFDLHVVDDDVAVVVHPGVVHVERGSVGWVPDLIRYQLQIDAVANHYAVLVLD